MVTAQLHNQIPFLISVKITHDVYFIEIPHISIRFISIDSIKFLLLQFLLKGSCDTCFFLLSNFLKFQFTNQSLFFGSLISS